MIQDYYIAGGLSLFPLLMLLCCWRWKEFGRALFVLIFLGAGVLNLQTALATPEQYLWFANLTPVGIYQQFIRGLFSRHIPLFVGTIAVAQLVIGLLLSLRGSVITLGLLGVIVFLLGITPLGAGAAFPAPLIMAAAAVLLLRHSYPETLLSVTATRLRSWLDEGD